MENQITLKNYIEHLTTLLDLPKTDNVQKKIQKKFERTLKDDLKIWETAETVPVAKTKAKIFNFSDLEKAYKLNENYLAKILQLDVVSLEEQREYNSWLMSQKTIVSKEEFDKTNEIIKYANEKYNQRYKISLDEQNNIMLKALFEKFFTPIDLKQWEKDKMVVENVTDTNDLNYLSAQQRLTTKDGRAYFKEK
ncbi:hypothetical protein HO918_01155 [Streptococcus suis]|uniref:hypothetical protein n=2 Tax=Streptococcus suis TaxID=1307 RepID=UPI0005CDC982|nr:hypothetical protein [Streptococcus suis]NQH08242.1 hypothetical protein [Streptococcus suis]NQP41583.1 hypothetical protein [Streptococcus suis]CYV35742.1 Uncharacterised protein [Streptococcus suis]